jgi:uracil-DNA glycosylase family 4
MGLETCQQCPLFEGARQVVPGLGAVPSRLMFIGLAPGAREEWGGRPIWGRPYERLEAVLRIHGLTMDDVYVTNLVKHRPPGDRKPLKVEKDACRPWLDEEMARVRPEVVVTLGAPAGKMFYKDVLLRKDHGKVFQLDGFKLVPTFTIGSTIANPNLAPHLIADIGNAVSLRAAPLLRTNYRLATNRGALEYIGKETNRI